MAIGNSYPKDIIVEDADLFLGTKASTNTTVNYTAQGIANYLNINGKVSITGQMSFKFTEYSNLNKTISFPGGGGNNTPFASISQLIVSTIDLSGQQVEIFLAYLIDKEILLARQNEINSFGNYKITAYAVTTNPAFYTLDLEFIGGNGFILKDNYYDIVAFSNQTIIPATPSLDEVLTVGNTSLLNAKVGDLYLWDAPNGDYAKISVQDSIFRLDRAGGGINILTSDNGSNFILNNGNAAAQIINSLTTSRSYILPNQSGTIALTTDILPAPGLNDVLLVNNTSQLEAKVGSLYLYDDPNGQYAKVSISDDVFRVEKTGGSAMLSSDGGYTLVLNNGNAEAFMVNQLTTSRNYTFPDKSGTFAMLSDISSITPSALTKTDDINVTLTLGGTPDTSLLQATSLTLGWTGTLADSRIASAATWNAKGNGTVTSVGMTVPTAFSVMPSIITTSGTFAITGAGTASQYIRGDGQLATFPTSGGGGSSVFYYLNGSVAASVATYKQMSNAAVIGTGTDFSLTGNGLIAQFLTDAGNPNRLEIPGGAWNFEMFFSMSSSGGTPKFYVELLKYDGAVFTSIANGSLTPETISGGTPIDLYLSSLAVPTTTLLLTDRLAVRVYIVNNSGGRTATLHTEDGHLCQIITTFSAGISAINGLTSNNQYLAVGTSGTDFNINSALETHTFNLPDASATARGVVTTGTQTLAGTKTLSTAPILSSLTASQLLALDTSKNIQSLDTATYPSLTELSYVKGVTSPIQTQLNAISNSIKSVVKDTVPKIITGTVSQTIVSSYLISANTFVANDFLKITNLMFSHSGNGTWFIIVYVNSSASLTGAVRIAGTSTQGATTSFGQLQKSFALDGTNMRGAGFGVLSFTDINSSTVTMGSTAYNLTQDKYIIVTITPSLSADINTQEGINITN